MATTYLNTNERPTARNPADDQDTVFTDKQSVDRAPDQSFPASDPISPSAVEKTDLPISPDKNDKDWTVISQKAQPLRNPAVNKQAGAKKTVAKKSIAKSTAAKNSVTKKPVTDKGGL